MKTFDWLLATIIFNGLGRKRMALDDKEIKRVQNQLPPEIRQQLVEEGVLAQPKVDAEPPIRLVQPKKTLPSYPTLHPSEVRAITSTLLPTSKGLYAVGLTVTILGWTMERLGFLATVLGSGLASLGQWTMDGGKAIRDKAEHR